MTNKQLAEKIAIFMGYKNPTNPDEVEKRDIDHYNKKDRTLWVWINTSELRGFCYLDDWNDWREVELKVMEDNMLHAAFVSETLKAVEWKPNISGIRTGRVMPPIMAISKADLPTRCRALVSVLSQL